MSSKSEERVSILTLEEGKCFKKLQDEDRIWCEEETEVDASHLEWIPKKIIQRGKATGVTVDEQKGRWDAVIEFAQEREKQKRSERGKGQTKRKGARELNSLCSSINYERVKGE